MDEDLLPKSAHLMKYGVSTLDPRIDLPDNSLARGNIKVSVEKRIINRLSELEQEYKIMVDMFNINKTVLESEFSFEPKQSHIYHLYEREDGSTFLSLIEPHQWDKFLLVSVRLTSDGVWEEFGG